MKGSWCLCHDDVENARLTARMGYGSGASIPRSPPVSAIGQWTFKTKTDRQRKTQIRDIENRWSSIAWETIKKVIWPSNP